MKREEERWMTNIYFISFPQLDVCEERVVGLEDELGSTGTN